MKRFIPGEENNNTKFGRKKFSLENQKKSAIESVVAPWIVLSASGGPVIALSTYITSIANTDRACVQIERLISISNTVYVAKKTIQKVLNDTFALI